MSHDEQQLPAPGSSSPVSAAYAASSPPASSYAYTPTCSPAPAAAAGSMTMPAKLSPLEKWAVQASESQFNAVSGAIGGFTSGIVTCPLDVIKTKLQAQGGLSAIQRTNYVGAPRVYRGLVGTGSIIWRDEGIRGLYRGLGPIILGYLPTWAVWFTVYNKSKHWVGQYQHNTLVINFWSSIIAGASSTIVTNPIWVIKTRLMSQTSRHSRSGFSVFPKGSNTPTSRPTLHTPWHYRSTLDAARKMYTTEGILSFYSGLTPALLGLTHVAVQFPAYEFLKTKFTGQGMGEAPAEGEEAPSAWLGILSASILSKIMASSATYPHEVIRTRLQTQRRPVAGMEQFEEGGVISTRQQPPNPSDPLQSRNNGNSQPKYRGVVMTFRTILREEGWRAFYAGMGTNMMRAVPAATVTMLTYEYVMRSLNKARSDGEQKLADARGHGDSAAASFS